MIQNASFQLERAAYYASFSTCADKQVGCILLNSEQRAIAFGYNQVLDNKECIKCQIADNTRSTCPAVHAEMAALIQLIQSQDPNSRPIIAICTLEPCIECTKALALAGVKEIYYDRPTNPRKSGSNIWKTLVQGGIWEQVSKNNSTDSRIPSSNGETPPVK